MIYSILSRCIEELSKENPKLDYIRGMLEVLAEQEKPKEITNAEAFKINGELMKTIPPIISKDEGSILDGMAKAAMKNMPKIEEA